MDEDDTTTEPWEFPESTESTGREALQPARRRWFSDFRSYNHDTQFALIAFALLGASLAVLLTFVTLEAAWEPIWTSWLVDRAWAFGTWLGTILAILALAGTVAVCWRHGRALWWRGGAIFGGLVAVVVFLVGWGSAVNSWGWLLGLAFGWIPAAIVAAMAGAIAWALAPLLVVALVAGLSWWLISMRTLG